MMSEYENKMRQRSFTLLNPLTEKKTINIANDAYKIEDKKALTSDE